MARLLLLDIYEDRIQEVECNELDDYYKYLRCDCFDIARRKLDNKYFDIFVDDEGLLKDDPIVSAITIKREPMLVGNLIFANHDGQGNTVSLSDEDIKLIKSHILDMSVIKGSEVVRIGKVAVGVEY